MALPKLETPTYELVQPSTGKKIKFRPFLVKEHKILLTMSEAEDEEVIRIVKELVDVCTFKQLNVNNLPHFDIEYIFMMLRAKSIGESVDVVITCNNCSEKYDSSFNIEDLKVENIGKKSNKILLTNNVGVDLSYPKFDEIVKLHNSADVNIIFDLVKKSITGVFNGDQYFEAKEQDPKDIEEFLFSLTKEQFEKIEEFFVTSPKVVQVVETDCPKCSHHNTSRIEGLQNFFV
jgi:hypothetical protein